jgi:hypothetical protein
MGVAWQGVNAHPRFSLQGRNQAGVLSLLCRTYHPYQVLTWIMLAEMRSARLIWPPSHSTRRVYMCVLLRNGKYGIDWAWYISVVCRPVGHSAWYQQMSVIDSHCCLFWAVLVYALHLLHCGSQPHLTFVSRLHEEQTATFSDILTFSGACLFFYFIF